MNQTFLTQKGLYATQSNPIFGNLNLLGSLISQLNEQTMTKTRSDSNSSVQLLSSGSNSNIITFEMPDMQFLGKKQKENQESNETDETPEKKLIKNNKFVYVLSKNTSRRKEKVIDESKLISKHKCKNLLPPDQTGKRGSKFRGVSRNGNQWQVLIMVKKRKRYVGSYSNEIEAARNYDKVAIQHHTYKAKTNYFYTDEEIERIRSEPLLLQVDDE